MSSYWTVYQTDAWHLRGLQPFTVAATFIGFECQVQCVYVCAFGGGGGVERAGKTKNTFIFNLALLLFQTD